ncbi:MAG: MgtC/SapB family protein [Spirochaetaceae bacterium]|nr:MAG: MgtC/SapB family protein [Spirochaetaceae bacterium]
MTTVIPGAEFALEHLLQLALSLIAGGAIGLERERSNQPAGLRTHILIALGATLLMQLSRYIALPPTGGDPGRIAAQVVSGIGFLGAGAILRFGGNVKGLTTAASIWIVAALGLVIGGGLYLLATAATLLVLFTLTTLNQLEKRMFPDRSVKVLEVNLRDTRINTDTIVAILRRHGIHVSNIDVTQALEKKTVKMKFIVKIAEDTDLKALYDEINAVDTVYQVKLEQLR